MITFKPVRILKGETEECMELNERVYAYKSLKHVLLHNACFKNDFNISDADIAKIDIEESESHEAVQRWWERMSEKYDLPWNEGCAMFVDFDREIIFPYKGCKP